MISSNQCTCGVSTICVLLRKRCVSKGVLLSRPHSHSMMTTQNLCSAAKLNFPAGFGIISNETRGAWWSNHPCCVHFLLPVIASELVFT
jgi:hypothetical protein